MKKSETSTMKKNGGRGRKLLIVVAVFLVLAAIGGALGEDGANTESTAPQEDAKSLDSIVGMTVPDAQTEIADMGIDATYYFSPNGKDEQEVGKDPSSITGEGLGSDWVVAKVDGKKVFIDTPGHLEAIKTSAENRKVLESNLSSGHAWTAVQKYGEDVYPYGFKAHFLMNEIAAEPEDESTWFLKTTCDVTNEFGAEATGLTLEAKVTGTNDNPQVVEFNVY